MKKVVIILITIIGILVCLILFTAKGGRFVFKQALGLYAEHTDINSQESKGSLFDGISFTDIELDNVKFLPPGNKLKIQRLFLDLKTFSLTGLKVEIENARLVLPDKSVIIVGGTISGEKLDFNVFSPGLSIEMLQMSFKNYKGMAKIKGDITNVDLYIKGDLKEPNIFGSLFIKKLIYKGFTLSESAWDMDVSVKGLGENTELFGKTSVENGTLKTQKVSVSLDPGGVLFSGSWSNPGLMLRGQSKVEKTKINIVLKGPVSNPDITLISEPPYSKQKLMVMLATGKSWKGVESSIDTGTFSKDLSNDFIDYFFFAGRSNAFAQKLGIHDVSVTVDKDVKGIGAKKDISDKIEVGYDVEQRLKTESASTVSQKVQGVYKATENVSLGAEQEVVREYDHLIGGNDPVTSKRNEKVFIEYQKKF